MGISSTWKDWIRKTCGEHALRRELDWEDNILAPNIFVIDFALFLFNKPNRITNGKDLMELYILPEILWFLRKSKSTHVICAFDNSKYVPNAKGPTQKKRDEGGKKDYQPDNKTVAELFGINEGPLEKDWSNYLKDRRIRAMVFNWVIDQLEKLLPTTIPLKKVVLIATDGNVFEWGNENEEKEEEEEEDEINGSCLFELKNTVGEADFFGVFCEQVINRLCAEPENDNFFNVLIRSIDQDSIPITLLGTASRFSEKDGNIRNHVYVMLSNRKITDPEELKRMDNINILKDTKTNKEYAYVKDYFDVNGCWRQLMNYYYENPRYKTLSNPIENISYIMFLDKCSDYSPGFSGIGALKMWETFEEHYDSIGGPLVICDSKQYYQDSEPFVYRLNYKALWRFLRLIHQLNIQANIPKQIRHSLILGYTELYDISQLKYKEGSIKRLADAKKVQAVAMNALWALHYYANGHRGEDFIPDCLTRQRGLSVWGFELVDKTKERSRTNTKYSDSVYWNIEKSKY